MDVFVAEEKFKNILSANGISDASSLWNLSGEEAKKKTSARGTEKILLDCEGTRKSFYLKRYNPIPLREILKNAISFKPLFLDGALHEMEALKIFERKGLPAPKPVAAAKFPDGRTCVLTLGINNYVRASEFLSGEYNAGISRRRAVIAKIAKIAGLMHLNNLAHQDLYLLHFFVVPSENDNVYLIDLQRLIVSKKLSERWIVKDLAQLLFSSQGILSNAEILRLWILYGKFSGTGRNKSTCKKVLSKFARIRKLDKRRRKRD
ncbi:MAG TPA: lipopolysaccharide kinase InaA family protein [Victivallales bacterium]|mgnify:CR=1 FL=1|nr:lipopolysaccharide kinase InaA family protein [Victivallales bacterium]